ncbi:Uncharacterised protein [Vibrio cholerae]|nr:Uncharacterised protein [Vibrio cholerae]CSI30926.1 Uncharacterised protein [Vibrio cholerae]
MTDVLFVFPVIFEHVPQHAPNKGYVTTRTQGNKVIRFCCSTGTTRIGNHDFAAVFLFRDQNVLHRDWVCFCWVRSNEQHRLTVVHVIE